MHQVEKSSNSTEMYVNRGQLIGNYPVFIRNKKQREFK